MAKTSSLDYERIINSISAREFSPMYFLQGEEPYFIDKISEHIENTVLKPEEKSFNQTILYGGDTTIKNIVDAAKRFPMMSEYQLIIVKEAQAINMRKSNWDDLIRYLENPLKSTILVFNYKDKKIDMRTKLGKLLQQFVFYDNKKLYDNQIPDWIAKYIKKQGKVIEGFNAELIGEFLGNDLSKIANEIDKMLVQIPKEVQLINTKHIEDNIGVSKDYNIFELQKSIGENNFNKSIQIINYFIDNPKKNPLTTTVSNLYNYFNKLIICLENNKLSANELSRKIGVNQYYVNEYVNASRMFGREKIEYFIELLKYYDLRSKGYGGNSTSEGELLRELIIRIYTGRADAEKI